MTETVRVFLAGLRLWARTVRSGPVLAMAIGLACVAGVALVATGSRTLEATSVDDLRQAAEDGRPEQRSIRFQQDTRIGPGQTGREPFAQIDDTGSRFAKDEMPTMITELVDEQHFVIESPPYLVSSFPDEVDGPFPTTFRFRQQDDIENQLTLVSGRMPDRREPVPMLFGFDCPPNRLDIESHHELLATLEAETEAETDRSEIDCRVVEVPSYEVAVTAKTATDLSLDIGQPVLLRPDQRNRAWSSARKEAVDRRIILSISGIIELTDLENEYWYEDNSLHRPRITENADFRLIFASGLFEPGQYRQLIRDTPEGVYRYTWRYLIDPDRLDPDSVEDVEAKLSLLTSDTGVVVTLLPDVIQAYLKQRTVTIALLATAFAGVLAAVAITVHVLASLAAQQRRATIRLLLERGVGRSGIVFFGFVHGLAVAIPATAVGLAAARFLVPEASWPAPTLAGLAIAALTVAAVVLAASTTVGSIQQELIGGGDGAAAVVGGRRLVRDGSVLVIAVGVVISIQRQAGAVSGSEATAGRTAVIALAPVVTAAALGIIVFRLIGPLARGLANLGSRWSGLSPFIGFRRLLAADNAARSSVLILILATAVAGLATAVRVSVVDAQEANAWQQVGADLTVRGDGQGAPLGLTADRLFELASEAVPGSSAAVGVELPLTPTVTPAAGPPITVLAIDADRYREILIAAGLDAGELVDNLELLVDSDQPEADGSAPPPVIVSPDWGESVQPAVGDNVEIIIGDRLSLRAAAVVERFPSMIDGQPFLIVDRARLQPLVPVELQPTVLYLGMPAATSADSTVETAGLEAAIGAQIAVMARQDLLDGLSGDPFIALAVRGMTWLVWFAAALAFASVGAGLVITDRARRRDLTMLMVIGLRSAQATLITLIENMLPVALAVLAGTGLALWLPRLLGPVIPLGPFTGGSADVAMTLDPRLAAAIGGIVLVAVAAVLIVGLGSGSRRRRENIVNRDEE